MIDPDADNTFLALPEAPWTEAEFTAAWNGDLEAALKLINLSAAIPKHKRNDVVFLRSVCAGIHGISEAAIKARSKQSASEN